MNVLLITDYHPTFDIDGTVEQLEALNYTVTITKVEDAEVKLAETWSGIVILVDSKSAGQKLADLIDTIGQQRKDDTSIAYWQPGSILRIRDLSTVCKADLAPKTLDRMLKTKKGQKKTS